MYTQTKVAKRYFDSVHFHNSHSFSSLTGLDEEGGEDEGGMANQ